MLSLSPAKILVVLVIALIVLGPEKLPGVARQMGAAWGEIRRFRARLENEVRGVFPDLPPTHEVAQAVRSPLSFLNRLADEHERNQPNGNQAGASAVTGAGTEGGSGTRAPPGDGAGGGDGAGASVRPAGADAGGAHGNEGTVWFATERAAGEPLPVAPDDPSMN